MVAGKNMELLEKMESLFNVWHGQIEQVLTEHEQIRREADNIGPDVELQYWKNRMDKFHMYVTLDAMIIHVLSRVQSDETGLNWTDMVSFLTNWPISKQWCITVGTI